MIRISRDPIKQQSGIEFDVLFGPAYKGITLCAAVAIAFEDLYQRDVPFTYNRKEAKDHGEGGVLVGADVIGKRYRRICHPYPSPHPYHEDLQTNMQTFFVFVFFVVFVVFVSHTEKKLTLLHDVTDHASALLTLFVDDLLLYIYRQIDRYESYEVRHQRHHIFVQ